MALSGDKRFALAGERMRCGERPADVLHDLFPAVVYLARDIGPTRIADSSRCAVVDDVGRRCLRRSEHDQECIIAQEFELRADRHSTREN